MKKIVIWLVLVMIVAALTGCADYPYVKIVRDNSGDNSIIIPIGHGFVLTKQVYTIEEHKDGYDIIIHVKAGVSQ